jgi:hypothetical protein
MTIFIVIADPYSNEVRIFFNSKHLVFRPYTDRPKIARFLET